MPFALCLCKQCLCCAFAGICYVYVHTFICFIYLPSYLLVEATVILYLVENIQEINSSWLMRFKLYTEFMEHMIWIYEIHIYNIWKTSRNLKVKRLKTQSEKQMKVLRLKVINCKSKIASYKF